MMKKPEGLYKLESYRYFRSALTAPVKRRQQPLFYITLYFFAGFLISYTISTSPCPVAIFMAVFSLITFIAAFSVGEYLRNTPSLATLMPISERKRLIYRFTSSLYMLLRIILYALAAIFIIFVIGVIIALISLAVHGGDMVADSSEGASAAIPVLVGKYGGIFSVAFVIICFSAGVIAGYFKHTKNRNRFIICFIVAVIIAFILTGLPDLIARRASYTFLIPSISSPFIEDCYTNMPVPWLCSLMWCLAAAGSLAAAIYMGIRKINASQY